MTERLKFVRERGMASRVRFILPRVCPTPLDTDEVILEHASPAALSVSSSRRDAARRYTSHPDSCGSSTSASSALSISSSRFALVKCPIIISSERAGRYPAEYSSMLLRIVNPSIARPRVALNLPDELPHLSREPCARAVRRIQGRKEDAPAGLLSNASPAESYRKFHSPGSPGREARVRRVGKQRDARSGPERRGEQRVERGGNAGAELPMPFAVLGIPFKAILVPSREASVKGVERRMFRQIAGCSHRSSREFPQGFSG